MEIEKKFIEIGERPDGSKVRLPIIKIKGEIGGPSIFIGVTIHGSEVTGQVSIWKLLDYIEKHGIKGELTIIPVMNPEGFNYNVRGIPESTIDLNRIYPGDPNGSFAERMVAKIWEIAKKHDLIIDVHTAGKSIPFVILDPAPQPLRSKIEEYAYSMGITVLDEFPPEKYERRALAKSLPGVAIKENIPSFTVELPGYRGVDEVGAEVGFRALKNLLIKIGMLQGELERVDDLVPVIKEKGYRRETIQSSFGGLVELRKKIGEKVDENEVVAVVRNVFGEIIGEVKSPWSGYIISVNASSRVTTGGTIASIAIRMEEQT